MKLSNLEFFGNITTKSNSDKYDDSLEYQRILAAYEEDIKRHGY